MKIFLQGEVLTAVDLNNNFKEVSTEGLDPRYYGGTFLTGWTQYPAGNSQSISYILVNDAPVGNAVIQVSNYVSARGPYIPLDTTLDYTVEFWARKSANGSSNSGNVYLVVSEYDTNLTTIAGDGADWYYPIPTAQQNTFVLNTWTKFGPYSIGPNSDRNHYANGKFISVGFTANYGNGNDTIQFTGFRISPYSTGGGGGTGPMGPRGYTGSAGAGYIGSIGSLGYTGSTGAGYTGSRGTDGYAGSNGTNGYTGSAGAGYTGSKGDIGYSGSAGYIGLDGYTGSIGFTGSAGTSAINGYGSAGQILISNGSAAEFKSKFYAGDYDIIPVSPEYGDIWFSTIDNKPYMWANNGYYDTWYDFLPPSN
jgi:hypothetical protein